jgi:hypothetical protein
MSVGSQRVAQALGMSTKLTVETPEAPEAIRSHQGTKIVFNWGGTLNTLDLKSGSIRAQNPGPGTPEWVGHCSIARAATSRH